ncbi:membrane protein [Paenibacillus jamilae]|uniref:Membrane protein n=1 Tax=Paenibacillus jamilae TaxID=114136 RepID=A0ACC4ZQM0_9BACL|nr:MULTISPECIES: DUF2238 domain-containing protein [Paenibacillus]AUO09344.1 DUF2238 domain-containing protein [Paenibacillus sp. lzh-N1]KTS80390.1 membrane protein [Paenibacillus jamilae]QOH61540.1 DUF2238 domain-containing protein [Paenibacillus polymyxa]
MNQATAWSKNDRYPLILLVLLVLALIWSLVRPADYFTWVLEVLPAVLGAILLAALYRRFRFTNLVYTLIWLHALILIVGGHYTYAEMPLFNWIRDTFGLERNYYDRLGHFAQGFVPALIVREVLLRKTALGSGSLLTFLTVSVCLAISAVYELIEFAVAKATGTAAEAFLGTQGDVWDTQWDMLLAFIGALTAVILLSGVHNKLLKQLKV